MAPLAVLITGCSSGIGLSTAVLLAKDTKQEFKVYATLRNMKSKADLETAAGDALNKTLFIRELDVTKETTISSVVDEILRDNGRIDVLVNNAGFSGVDAIDQRPLEWCQAMMDTNYWGVVRSVRAVLPAMKKQQSGKIINVTSVSGIVGTPFFATYTSSKFAVEGFSESIAPVLRDGYNISVSIVEPGPVQTPLVDNLRAVIVNPEETKDYDAILKDLFLARFTKSIELEKMMQTADEIAQLHLDIIRSDKPHLRYQTSDVMTKYVAAMKLNDTTTDALLNVLK